MKPRKPRRAPTVPAEIVFAKARSNPEYRRAYAALDDEFSLVAAIIRARMSAGLTQAEVARRMGTTQAVIARLEAGGRQPSTRTLSRFAAATGHRLRIDLVPRSERRRAA